MHNLPLRYPPEYKSGDATPTENDRLRAVPRFRAYHAREVSHEQLPDVPCRKYRKSPRQAGLSHGKVPLASRGYGFRTGSQLLRLPHQRQAFHDGQQAMPVVP